MNKKIYIISFISVIAILVLLIGLMVVRQGGINGPSVSLPSAVYAACIDFDQKPLTLTIDRDGELSCGDKQLSLPQLKNLLNELSSEGESIFVMMRVDGNCQFGNLQPILTALENEKVTGTSFRVYEE